MRCVYCEAPLPDSAMFCGECGNAVHARDEVATAAAPVVEWDVEPEPRPEPEPESEVRIEPEGIRGPGPESAPGGEVFTGPGVPVPDESTRFVERRPEPASFVLHFSTGETVTVTGSGLIGRRPTAQPGEYFDEYVTIEDPGRSISKTHLEFGQDGGVLWISDRFSANGTVVREPDRSPRLCPSGRRTRVARGSRVDIGEQFFLVG